MNIEQVDNCAAIWWADWINITDTEWGYFDTSLSLLDGLIKGKRREMGVHEAHGENGKNTN